MGKWVYNWANYWIFDSYIYNILQLDGEVNQHRTDSDPLLYLSVKAASSHQTIGSEICAAGTSTRSYPGTVKGLGASWAKMQHPEASALQPQLVGLLCV
jgi:hypothetical protein